MSFEELNLRNIEHGGNLSQYIEISQKHLNELIEMGPLMWTCEVVTKTAGEVIEYQNHQIKLLKARVCRAIEYKQLYYTNHWLGKITKFFLKFFCLWNEGNTPAIFEAKRFRDSLESYNSEFFHKTLQDLTYVDRITAKRRVNLKKYGLSCFAPS